MSKRKPGRPSKFTSAVAARICRAIAEGLPRASAAALVGVNVGTLYDWAVRFPEFAESIQKADAAFESEQIGNLRRAGTKSRTWAASAWLLERTRPEKYGKVDRHFVVEARAGQSPSQSAYTEALRRALGVSGPLVFVDAEGKSVDRATEASRSDGQGDLLRLPPALADMP